MKLVPIPMAAALMVSALFLQLHHAWAGAVQCTVKLEACGGLEQKLTPLTKIKEGTCLKADLATIGKKPSGLYYTAFVWVGVGVSGDTLVFGKGEAKTGVMMECSWNIKDPAPKDQIESLKKSIPALLTDQRLTKQFPGVKKIDVSGLKTIEQADPKCAEAIAAFAKKK